MPPGGGDDLLWQYEAIIKQQGLAWVAKHQLIQLLGSGTQGVVYLSLRQGADNFCFPVALKIFSPERYPDRRAYEEATLYMGRVAMRVAHIQQDNLVSVQNWVEHGGIRCMVMEWVEGHDLRYLVSPDALDLLRTEVSRGTLAISQRGGDHRRGRRRAGSRRASRWP